MTLHNGPHTKYHVPAHSALFQHQAEYEEILAGVKGADNCKRLSSQFIARFFGYFPSLMDQSIDAMLDLCEDANVDIRKQVGGD